MTSNSRLLLDVTATESSQLKTGIQRVTLELYQWLVRLHPNPAAVIPVYLRQTDGRWQHWQANVFRHRILGTQGVAPADELIELCASDTLLHLDLATTPVYLAFEHGLYKNYQQSGIRVLTLVYDLLPVRLTQCFPPAMEQHHRQWLKAVASFNGALCISKDVAGDLRQWFRQQHLDVSHLQIDWFKLGSDIGTFGLGSTAASTQPHLRLKRFGVAQAKTFLMVGTIEPRKGYADVLDAFDAVWAQGLDCRLVIVGREGWTHLPLEQRSAITEVIYRLEQHPERFRRLVWLSAADDASLEQAYAAADCLIAASLGEGFGLPLVEAASRGVPALARDIAVFREVAASGTVFFTADNLTKAIIDWQPPQQATEAPTALTWQDSAHAVLAWLSDLATQTVQSHHTEPELGETCHGD